MKRLGSFVAVSLAAGLLVAGCRCGSDSDTGVVPVDGPRYAAPAPFDAAPAPPDVAPAEPDVALPAPPSAAPAAGQPAIEWSFAPSTLDVYRDTEVTFRVGDTETYPETWTFTWDFGDETPPIDGRAAAHTYTGGQRDYLATLTVTNGGALVYEGTRKVPLERLRVVPLDEDDAVPEFAPDLRIPPPPPEGDTSFRFVVLSDSNASYGSIEQGAYVGRAVASIIERVHPAFVVHGGDMIAGQRRGLARDHVERMWDGYHAAVTAPLLSAGIPLLPVAGNHDAAPGYVDRQVFVEQWTRPEHRPRDVTLVDESRYPLAYTFTYEGAFFVVMDGAVGRVSEEDLRWLRKQLASARMYTARFVFSHVPLRKFTDVQFGDVVNREEAHEALREPAVEDYVEQPGLEKHFRLYNLFLETGVDLFLSGHYEVYYKGLFGSLRVVSTGNVAGTRRALSGQAEGQGPSFVVIDVVDGKLTNVFAVRGPDFRERFDESTLPLEVEDYRYDARYTPTGTE